MYAARRFEYNRQAVMILLRSINLCHVEERAQQQELEQ
jgi:hypothetical protein